MISVVLPTYNERDNIARLIEELAAVLDTPFECIVVDDDSPDGTAEVVVNLSKRIPGVVRLICRKNERGLTSAIQRGIDESLGEIIVWMDCDLSMPPAKIPELVHPIISGHYDVSVGSRFVRGGQACYEASNGLAVFVQKCATRLLNSMLRLFSGAKFCDWTSGFIAIRREVIVNRRLRGDYGEYFIHLMKELLREQRRIIEIPYENVPRRYGQSKTASSFYGLVRKGLKYVVALMS